MDGSWTDRLDLWDYRRRVAEIYRGVRERTDPEDAWRHWRDARDELFATHPQSPIRDRARFTGLRYFPYDPSWRMEGLVVPDGERTADLPHSAAGATRFSRFGHVELSSPGGPVTLGLYWLETYGGGVFLPFRDATNGERTYGGGRYLLDTAKGADLGHAGALVVIDLNFSYHPSCVHDPRWSCPLSPPENRLRIPVEAGEALS